MFKEYLFVMLLAFLVFGEGQKKFLEIYKSKHTIVAAGRSAAGEIDTNKLSKYLMTRKKVLDYKSVPQKKDSVSSLDTLKVVSSSRGKGIILSAKQNTVAVGENGIKYFDSRVSNSRKQTGEEMRFYYETKKLPKSWCDVDTNVAIGIARDFLENAVGLEALGYYDSIEVKNNAECYIFHFSIRQKRNICEGRRVTVRVNANSGDVEYYMMYNPEGYSDYEPAYVPKITLDEVQQILVRHGEEKGKVIRFESSPDSVEHTFYEVLRLCLKPKFAEEEIKGNTTGWMWYSFIKKRPGSLFQLNKVFVDSETGKILYTDL